MEKLAQPPKQDDDEDIEVVLMTPAEFEDLAMTSNQIDAKTICSYFLALPFI